jgi:putative DNA primase/helicase
MDKTTMLFLERLHLGGEMSYLWTKEGTRSYWYPVGKPLPRPNGSARNIYFGVHTTAEIPERNTRGEIAPPEKVRAHNECIDAINCLFSEFDAKDFGGSKPAALAHIKSLEPAPSVVIDSGGGYHAYWFLSHTWVLSSDDDRQRARALQRAWVTFTGGDQGAKDLARVLRLPGSANHKYDPPRPVDWVWCELDVCYPLETLESAVSGILDDPATKKPSTPQKSPLSASGGGRNLSAYVQSALDDEIEAVKAATEGARNDTLNTSAYSLGQLVGAPWAHLDRATVESALTTAACDAGLDIDPNCGKAGIEATIRSGLESGMLKPRPEPQSDLQEPPEPDPADLGADLEARNPKTVTTSGDPVGLLWTGHDDEGNAQAVTRLYPGRFLHTAAYGWLSYNGHFWASELAEPHLDRAIIDTLKRRRALAVAHDQEQIVKDAKPSDYRRRAAKNLLSSILAVSVGDFDGDPDLLNCQNGVLDLRTGQLITHEPSQRFTYCLPIEYDPGADRSTWVDFIYEAIGNPNHDDQTIDDLYSFLQRAVGYSLTGHTWEECLFYLYGPTRAGKGVFTETIIAMLGREPLAAGVDFASFTAKRDHDTQNFDLASLKPCRFVAAGEGQSQSWLNASKVKAITGGDEIRCAFKHRDLFSYRPQFKIWLASNHQVKADVDDDAAWYRLRVIEFPNSHAGCEDKTLKLRMRQPDVLRGLLAWAVEGTMAWYASGRAGLVIPAAVAASTQEARAKIDFVGQWLDECTGKIEGTFLPNAALYTSYSEWCKENGVKPKGSRALGKALSRKGYTVGVQKWHQGRNQRGVEGLHLTTGDIQEPLDFVS